MKKAKANFDLDYLRRCKYSSPESKLEWLSDAIDFAYSVKQSAIKTVLKKVQKN